jgi:CRP/FNR family transcriptional regulator
MDIESQIKKFFSGYLSMSYKKGEIVIRQEDEPQGVYYVKSGYVRMYQIYENGKELTINIFDPGSYFPMSWAIANIRNTYYFQAFTLVTINRAPKNDVVNLLKSNPEILYELTVRLISGFFGLISNLERLLSLNAYENILSMLVILANRFGKSVGVGKVKITLSLSHEDIAQLVGLTRETTSIELKKLMESNLIYYKRRYVIINNLKLLESKSVKFESDKYESMF